MAEKMQDRRQPDAAQIVRAATPSLGYQTDITNAEPKPRCGFRLRRPDHMRGLEAVCVQKFCRFPDSVLRGEMELIYKRVLLIF